jgi:hypothetical protein
MWAEGGPHSAMGIVMPRFVILLHELPAAAERGTHWDLMLEQGDALRTWALPCEPSAGLVCQADGLPDHRLAYLTYQGPVSGDRGRVTRWDEGLYTLDSERDGGLSVTLEGRRFAGRVELLPTDHSWRVSFAADPTRGSVGESA